MATPTKCTPEIVAELCRRLEGPPAITLTQACHKLVHRSVVFDWRARATRGEQPYADAIAEIDEARLAFFVAKLEELELLATSGTKEDTVRLNALKHQIDKLCRDWIDAPQRIELSGPNGGAIEISDDPEARRRRLEALLAKAAGPESADDDGTG